MITEAKKYLLKHNLFWIYGQVAHRTKVTRIGLGTNDIALTFFAEDDGKSAKCYGRRREALLQIMRNTLSKPPTLRGAHEAIALLEQHKPNPDYVPMLIVHGVLIYSATYDVRGLDAGCLH